MVEQVQEVGHTIKGNGAGSELSLEKRVELNFSSRDSVLAQTLSSSLQQEYSLQLSEPSSLSRTPITEPSNLYSLDLLQIPADDYGRILEKVKQIRAINPESKVVILATEGHQTSPDFSLFREAREYGLVGLITRPDPSQSTETEYASNLGTMTSELPDFLRELYRKRNGNLENVEVIKIGGSIFDLYTQNPDALHNLLTAIVEIHKRHDLILTVGGGPLMDIPAGFRAAYQMSDRTYQEAARAQITQQALLLVDLLEQIEHEKVAYLSPELVLPVLRYNWITRDFLKEKIPVFSYLPEQSGEIGIPPIPYDASDAHTVAVADKLGVRRIIFAKNTDGIYLRDPNLPRGFWQQLRPRFRGSENPRLDFVYANEIQDVIERMGLNQRGQLTGEHLIETRAIQPFIESRNLYAIQIVNGTKPKQLADAMNGIKVGSYIIK